MVALMVAVLRGLLLQAVFEVASICSLGVCIVADLINSTFVVVRKLLPCSHIMCPCTCYQQSRHGMSAFQLRCTVVTSGLVLMRACACV